ncbi:MAG: hypothetical protein K1X79_06615 [Oligoflexia bacterium]|nr:hypothetical protein [Oligoflexia bacterium]
MNTDSKRKDSPALIIAISVILLCAFCLRLGFAATRGIGFDEAWDIFVSRQDNLAQFFKAVSSTSHPLGFYALLRAFSLLGYAQYIDPLPSVICGTLSIFIFGQILGALGLPRLSILSGMAILAMSQSHILISVIVRPYMLAICCMLASLYYAIEIISSRFSRQLSIDLFWAYLTAACLSHFSALLFSSALVSATLLVILANEDLRVSLAKSAFSIQGFCYKFRAALVCLLIFATYLFLTSQGGLFTTPHLLATKDPLQLTPYRYLKPYLLQPNQSVLDFIIHAIAAEFHLFTPLSNIPALFAALLGVLLAGAMTIKAVNLRSPALNAASKAGRQLVLILAPIAFLLLLILGLMGKYPVGGELRQQFFLFPCLLAAVFVLVDSLPTRSAWGIALCALAALNLATQPLDDEEFGKLPQLTKLSTQLEPGASLYLGRWTAFTFFGQHRDWKLSFVEEQEGLQHYVMRLNDRLINLYIDPTLYFSQFLSSNIPDKTRALMQSRNLSKLLLVGFPQGRMKCEICNRSQLQNGLAKALGSDKFKVTVQRERTPNGEGFALIERLSSAGA